MAAEKVIRRLLVRLGVKADDKVLKDFDEKLEAAKETASKTVSELKRMAIATVAAGVAVVASTKLTADYARAIDNQAKVLGTSTTAYQEIAHATAAYGVETADLADAFGTIADKAQGAIEGSKTMVEDFGLIGLKVSELRGKDPEQLFLAVADAIASTTDPTKRAAAASRLFGDDVARKMVPLLVRGSAGIAELRKEAHELGLVLDEEAIAKSREFSIRTDILWRSLGALRDRLGLALMPALDGVVSRSLEWVRANRLWLDQRLDVAGARIGRAFLAVEGSAKGADHAVRRYAGGWGTVLTIVAAVAGQVGAIVMLRRLVTWLEFAKASLAVFGIGVGTTFGAFVGWVAAAAGALAFIAISFGSAFAVMDDWFTYLRGEKSTFGTMIERWKEAGGVLGKLATFLEALRDVQLEVFGAFGDLTGAAGEFAAEVKDTLQPVLDVLGGFLAGLAEGAVADVLTKIGFLLDGATGGLQFVTGAIRDARGGTVAPAGAGGPMAVAGYGDGGRYAFAPRSVTSSSSTSSSTTKIVNGGPTTVIVNGAGDPAATGEAVVRELRRAQAATAGGER